MYKLDLEKTEEPGIKLTTSFGSRKKKGTLKKKSTCVSLTARKDSDFVDHNKLWKTLKEMGIPDHLTCLLRHPYAGQKATVRTGHAKTDCFQIGI